MHLKQHLVMHYRIGISMKNHCLRIFVSIILCGYTITLAASLSERDIIQRAQIYLPRRNIVETFPTAGGMSGGPMFSYIRE